MNSYLAKPLNAKVRICQKECQLLIYKDTKILHVPKICTLASPSMWNPVIEYWFTVIIQGSKRTFSKFTLDAAPFFFRVNSEAISNESSTQALPQENVPLKQLFQPPKEILYFSFYFQVLKLAVCLI